jgi:uncharacterized repeat protein (TIGR03803 family)
MIRFALFMMLAAFCVSASGPQIAAQTSTTSLPAATFTSLYSFPGPGNPVAGLVQGADGNLYGTTRGFAGGGNGKVFKITPSGILTNLETGGEFEAALVLGTDGNFYGAMFEGGTSGNGTIFKITSTGTFTTLYDFGFPPPSGSFPKAALIQATDGNFYGTTLYGGTNSCVFGGTDYGCGTIFKITPSGALTTLHNFCSQSGCPDGESPEAALVQGTDGNLYGLTSAGGADDDGTVFKITLSGALTTLHSFSSTDGSSPEGALIQASDGNFYGTTAYGANSSCTDGCGTIFKITAAGALTTLHSFDSADGAIPTAGLIQATDGSLYGTTSGGGADGAGTVFQLASSGKLTTLHSFGTTDGGTPTALLQDTSGTLYGMTFIGGINNYHFCGGRCGTIYSLSVGLGPFVKANPVSGNVGTTVTILGTNLTGATSVTFNGTAATFTVLSSSAITTTVPAGATTGAVTVVTPNGTLSSNVPFQVP